MSKYSIGDRVRIVSFMGNEHSPLTGITGRVMDTPGYGNIVKLDRDVKIHGSWSKQSVDLLLIIDSELEYEDNGAGGWPCDQPSKHEFIYHHGD